MGNCNGDGNTYIAKIKKSTTKFTKKLNTEISFENLPLVSKKTLENNSENFKKAITEIKDIQKKAAENRKSEINELSSINDELIDILNDPNNKL